MEDHARDLAVIRAAFEALRRRDDATLRASLHPECEFHSAIMAVEGTVYRGQDAIAEFMRDVQEPFDDFGVGDPEEIRVVGGGEYVVLYRITATGPGSGIQVDQEVALHVRMQDGRMRYGRTYLSAAECFAAAGING